MIQAQNLCVYENEDIAIDLEIFDVDDTALDLTGATVLMVVWAPPDGTALFTKNSGTPSEITIDPDQVANTGKAQVFIAAADLANSGVFAYNVWVDIGGNQRLVVPQSRFEILIARRS